MLAFILDLVNLAIGIYMFSSQDPAYEATLVIVFSALFIGIDMYLVVWVISLRLKLPTKLARSVNTMLSGVQTSTDEIED